MTDTVYLAYHQWAPRVEGGAFTPIHVGRAVADTPIAAMLGDDTGVHISGQNDAWCELTALFWAWKNDKHSARIGLMHYRRVLDILGDNESAHAERQIARFDVKDWTARAQAELDQDEHDIIVAREHIMGRTVEQNYKHTHQPQDWDILRDVISRYFPEYENAFEHVARHRCIRLGNLAIMTRAVLNRYCTFLFGALEKVAAHNVDRSHYSAYQARYLGFLAERLLTTFILREQRTKPDTKIREVGILNLDQAMIAPYMTAKDRPAEKCVNVAVSTDRNYLPHAAALLRSVLDHADRRRPMNIFLLHSDVSRQELAALASILSDARDGVFFHPINIGVQFDRSYRSVSRGPSNATYNRFLLFALLPDLDRLLYLDADMIVTRDICTLYDTDMCGAPVGAVTDFIMTRTLTGPTPTAVSDVPDLGEYQRKVLGLEAQDIARYFNAGVMLFDFQKMGDPVALGNSLMQEAREGRYLFRDQDILNKAFKGNFFQLDPRWNVFNGADTLYARVPRALWAHARSARADPWIVHYADRGSKPWQGRAVAHGHLYWEALGRTPFLQDVTGPRKSHYWSSAPHIVALGRAIAYRVPFLRRPLLRIYAIVRSGR